MPKLFSFRCPDDLLNAITARSQDSGESLSKVVVDALRQALRTPEASLSSYARIEDLAKLKLQVEELVGKLIAS